MSWHYVDPHNFFPTEKEHYPYQKPYETSILPIGKIDWSAIYDGVENLEAEGENYCSTDACEIKLY